MNTYIRRMLTHVPQGADISPNDAPSLGLAGIGTLALTDLTLYVTNTTTNSGTAIDLHNSSTAAVAQQIPSGITATVLQDGPAELLLAANPTLALPTTLTIATAPLWMMLGAFSRALTTLDRADAHLAAEVNVRGATGFALDEWAASLGIPRHAGEPDSLFILRLVGQTLHPAANNRAIEHLLQTLGYPSTVTDTTPYHFTADVQMPTNPPQGFIYSQAQVASVIGDMKAAGMIALVNFVNSLIDNISFTDSAAASTTAVANNTWGNATWNQAVWQ